MELGTLSEIFSDPTLNDFPDSILNEIDVSEFKYIHTDDTLSSASDAPFLTSGDFVHMDVIRNKSSHGTLEALLRSQNPSTRVPPAPDLHTAPGTVGMKHRDHVSDTRKSSVAQFRRNSFPILKDTPQQSLVGSKYRRPNGRANLICDYLESCEDFLPFNSVAVSTDSRDDLEHNGHSSEGNLKDLSGVAASSVFHGGSHTADNLKAEYELSSSKQNGDNVRPDSGHTKTPKRSPHNAIEKRYRASINGRIDELRRILMPNPGCDTKSNKSAVLRQAIERIRELEEKNRRLQSEVLALRSLNPTTKFKPYNSSPDSGLSLFEPSPSGSSSYSGHDSTDLTPLNAIGNYFGFVPLPNHTANDSVNATIIEAVEALDNSWPISSYPDIFVPDSVYPLHESPIRMNEAPQYQLSQNILLPESNTPSMMTEAPVITGTRLKRKASTGQIGSKKVHRDSDFSPDYAETRHVRPDPPLLTHTVGSDAIRQSPADSAPTVRHLLLTANAASVETRKDEAESGVKVEFSGSLAARTTLCLAGLCFIALDPVVLSGNFGYPTSQVSSPGKSSSSRRLLSVFNGFGEETTPWTVWLVYVFQWIIALLLCLWACAKRSSIPNPRKRHVDRAALDLDWEEANQQIQQTAWSSVEQKLSACLVAMDPAITAFWSTSTSAIPYSLNHVYQCVDAMGLFVRTTTGILLRVPRILRVSLSKKPDYAPKKIMGASCPVALTPSQVRWRLLEVYLLAPKSCLKHSAILGRPLRCFQLLWECIKEFLDDSTKLLLANNDHEELTLSDEVLLRRGLTLVLVLNRFNSVGLSKIVSFLRSILQICIERLAQFQSSYNPSLWHQLANNPILWQLATEPSGLNLLDSLLGSSSLASNKEDQLENSLCGALQQKLVDRCLRSITTKRQSDLHKLEQSIATLIELCSPDDKVSTTRLPPGSSPISIKSHWWAQFIRILWINECRDPDDVSQSANHAGLPIPPQCVLQCSQTGLLAESAWLAFRPLPFPELVLSAQKSGLLLCQYLKRISTYLSTESLNQCASVFRDTAIAPYWMLACAHLTADHILSILARNLILSKPCPLVNSIQPPRLIESFNSALWVLRHSAVLIGSDRSDWVVKKISYYETIRRLVSGANPVQSRFSLMHACRNAVTRQTNNADSPISSQSFHSTNLDRSPTGPQLQRSLTNPEIASRYSLLNTSPGQ